MTEADALLRAVLSSPADDLPRLVYADWLEEAGEPEWAAVIRVMCDRPHEFDADVQVERMGVGRPPPDVAAALEWLEAHAPHHLSMLLGGRRCDRVPNDWPWVTGCPSLGLRVEWRRGLIARVWGPIEAVRAHLPRIAAANPVEWADAADKEPQVIESGRLVFWCAAKPDRPLAALVHQGSLLPRELFDRLHGDAYHLAHLDIKNYPAAGGVALAKAALSAALLAEALASAAAEGAGG